MWKIQNQPSPQIEKNTAKTLTPRIIQKYFRIFNGYLFHVEFHIIPFLHQSTDQTLRSIFLHMMLYTYILYCTCLFCK